MAYYIGAQVICTTEVKADKVVDWFEPFIKEEDFSVKIGVSSIHKSQRTIEFDGDENWFVGIQMYLKDKQASDKYLNVMKIKLGEENVLDDLVSFKVIKNENNTHDEQNTKPDVVETVLEWP